MRLFEIVSWKCSSYHGVNIYTTPDKLMRLWDEFGLPYYSGNDGEDKTNFDFTAETEDGMQIAVYDWKEGRPLAIHEVVEFHIGGRDFGHSMDVKKLLEDLLEDM